MWTNQYHAPLFPNLQELQLLGGTPLFDQLLESAKKFILFLKFFFFIFRKCFHLQKISLLKASHVNIEAKNSEKIRRNVEEMSLSVMVKKKYSIQKKIFSD